MVRYLQTLTEISVEQNSTIIFPVPVDIFKGIAAKMGLTKDADDEKALPEGDG